MTYNRELKNAILDVIKAHIDRNNNGLLATHRPKFSNLKMLANADLDVVETSGFYLVTIEEDKVVMRFQKKHSNRKTNLCYKELIPTLIENNL